MAPQKDRNFITAIACVLLAIVTIQGGAPLAKQLFPIIGAEGATALRLGFSAILLACVFRPWRYRPTGREWKALILYGTSLGVMNFFFYLSIQRIPLGIAVALEFTGPLGLALFSSSRKRDWLWVVCASLGIVCILPHEAAASGLDGAGVCYALLAGLCWGGYIIFGRWVGQMKGGLSVSYGMIVAAAVVLPLSVGSLSRTQLSPKVLLLGLLVALFSSALPYSFEMVALRRLPTRTFSILMSLEPAFAALSGLLFLQEHLSPTQWLAILLIIVASVGTSLGAQEKAPFKEVV